MSAKVTVLKTRAAIDGILGRHIPNNWYPADNAGDCVEPGCNAAKRAQDPHGLALCTNPSHALSHGTRVLHSIGAPQMKLSDLIQAVSEEIEVATKIAATVLQHESAKPQEVQQLRLIIARMQAAAKYLGEFSGGR